MYPRFLTLLMMIVMLANQAIIALSHSHGEVSDPSSRPHIHLSSHDHVHSHHGHHHGHHHRDGHHHHHSDPPQDDHSTEDPSVLTCELVFVADTDVVISQSGDRLGITKPLLQPRLSAPRFTERISDSFIAKSPKTWTALAHAPILNKIRLLI